MLLAINNRTHLPPNSALMRHNLLNPKTAALVTQRVQQLSADKAPLWGSMTAAEMLLHCNRIHQQLLEATESATKPTTLRQHLVRIVVLYLMPHFPKGAKAPARVVTKGLVSAEGFEKEKADFVNWISRFATHTVPITAGHPYFGRLSTNQWGLAAYKHIDHHLRQFGV